MNTEQIIKMGYEAGLCDEEGADEDCIYIHKHLTRFAELVAAAEREACAQLCENLLKPYCDGYGNDGEAYAEEIRARK